MTATNPPSLSYAAAPAREGIILEELPDGVRIIKPPEHPTNPAVIVILILLSPLILVVLLLLLIGGGDWFALYRTIRSAGKPLIIEVTGGILAIRNIVIDGDVQPDITRPRDKVYEVKFVSHSGNLFIRAHGHEIIDCRPFDDPLVVQWVAQVLRAALGLEAASKSS
jgi:hypothetical protein